MPDWPRVRLDECCEIVSGATPSTAVADYWDGDICWVTPKDLSNLEGAIISDTPRKITQAGLASCAAEVLPAGSVLFSSRAPIGHVAINAVPMATNQGFKSFIPDTARLDAKFLYWWLRANRAYLESLGNGATFKEVSKAVVSRINIPLPHLKEQRRIADVLDRAEALRAKRRATIECVFEAVDAAFADRFGDTRSNPKGFRKAQLGELVKLKSGEFLPASRMSDEGDCPVFGGNGVSGYHDQYLFEEPKVIIGRVGVYCGCVHLSPPKSWITDNALYVSEHSGDIERDYLAHALRLAGLNQYASQSGQPLVSGSRLYPVEILVPPRGAQREFGRLVAGTERVKRHLVSSLETMDALFESLQNRAFHGEL